MTVLWEIKLVIFSSMFLELNSDKFKVLDLVNEFVQGYNCIVVAEMHIWFELNVLFSKFVLFLYRKNSIH